MLPTLTIPNVAPPARASEPAGPAADGEGNDAFAQVLQRAQGGPKPARTGEPRPPTSKTGDAHARSAHRAESHSAKPDNQPAGDDTACIDAVASNATRDPTAGDAASRPAAITADATSQPAAPGVVIDATSAPQPVIDANRSERPRGVDDEGPALAIDDRAALNRAGARSGGARELRAAPSMPARATLPGESAGGCDGTAVLPLRATLEHTAADAAAAPTSTALRAPTFERQPAEPSTTPLAAVLLPREMSGAASASTESKLLQATVHTAIDEPGFGAAIGTQVALWVRDGVQEARLQLHPAELGPVTVQIALEGQAAHVDFTAAVAATRDSIEQSLPALAAALREAGFTLTGGGVSSQAGHSGDGRRERAGARSGDRSRTDAGVDGGHAVAAPRRWTRSLLDIYA